MVINKKYFLVLMLLLLVLFSFGAVAVEKDCIYYFYGKGCPHCAAVKLQLDDLQEKYPDLAIQEFEIYYNRTNLLLLQDYFSAYEVPSQKQGVPAVFLSGSYFVGDKPVTNYLENTILSNEDENCPALVKDEVIGITGDKSPKDLIETLTVAGITSDAFADSINPCAIAIFLILLGVLLAAAKTKRKLLPAGLAFTTSIYVAFFLFGIGILGVISAGVSHFFYKLVGFLALLAGLLSIKDHFWPGKLLLKNIPQNWEIFMQKFRGAVATPSGAFIVGFVTCLFGLSCVGEPYQVLLGLLSEKATRLAAMPWLLYYNLIIVLPLAIASWLAYRSLRKTKKKEEKEISDEDKPARIGKFGLALGTIMTILGFLVLFFL